MSEVVIALYVRLLVYVIYSIYLHISSKFIPFAEQKDQNPPEPFRSTKNKKTSQKPWISLLKYWNLQHLKSAKNYGINKCLTIKTYQILVQKEKTDPSYPTSALDQC